MENMGNKKLALLYILQILKEYSDIDHPLTQSDIAEKLEYHHGIVLERKAISRNLSLLREAGYEVESTAKGNYLDEREFDDTELRLMIDGVLSSRYITEKQSKDLAERIAALSNKYFRSRVKHISLLSDYQKSNNKTVFYNLDIFDEAIEAGRKVSFDYCGFAYNDDLKPQRACRELVSPIQLVIKNQFYYLIAAVEIPVIGKKREIDPTCPQVTAFRLDLISNPIIEEESVVDKQRLKKYGEEYDVKKLLSFHPYMEIRSSKAVRASFLCFPADLKLVSENLGSDIEVKKIKRKGELPFNEFDTSSGKRYMAADLVCVSLKISLPELIEFACRYPQKIFIVSPSVAVAKQELLYKNHLEIADKIREYASGELK